MAKKLNAMVHVVDDKGVSHVFGPEDKVPTWAKNKIDNESVWEGEDDEPDAPIVKSPKGAAPAPE